jgi:UDP-N-acetyl-2-amino-2-deoxyglucuronate dehydrogenase
MKYKVGLVGSRGIAPTHAWALSRLTDLASLEAVCATTIESAEVLASEYGAKAYSDVEKMLDECALDALIVATPHMHHHQPALAALKRGIPVLLEKPIASTLEQTDFIIEASEKYNTRVAVCSQRQYMSPVIRVLDAVSEGKIGPLVRCDVRMNGWRDDAYYQHPWKGDMLKEGGAAMINQGVHAIAMALSFMGPVESVQAQVGNLTHPKITGEDFADILVRYKSGAVGTFLFTNSQREGYYAGATVTDQYGYNIEIQTDEVMFVAGPGETPPPPFTPRVNRWYVPVPGFNDEIPEERQKANKVREESLKQINLQDERSFSSLEHPQKSYHIFALKNFFNALNEEEEFCVDAYMGREAVQLITAAYLSNEWGEKVTLPIKADAQSKSFEGRNAIYRFND